LSSTVDYQLEMVRLSPVPTGLHANQTASSSSSPSTSSTFFSLNTGYRLFTSSKTQPDPDREDIVWNEPEQYSAAISRKERVRDVSGLPLIRDVLGRKATPTSSQLADDGVSTSISNGASSSPPKAQPNIALNAEAVGGVVSGVGDAQKADKLLHEFDEVTPTPSRQETPKPEPLPTTNPVEDYAIEEERRPSTTPNQSEHDEVKKGPESVGLDTQSLPPALPAKDVAIGPGGVATLPGPIVQSSPLPNSSSGFSMSLTSGINSAMKYLGAAESPSRFLVRGQSNTKKPGSRLTDMHTIDDRPHIRYDWTIGKRTKFSCTVYYAKEFELLRKKCGVHENFVTSLSKSSNWAAEGGKSKSNFWKTSDDRFIIKTLVNAWNVADLSVFPSSSVVTFAHYRMSGKC
jgi:1-phosphatidylinositol-3-phosphate 5-kinase